jgi:hypothetical protein
MNDTGVLVSDSDRSVALALHQTCYALNEDMQLKKNSSIRTGSLYRSIASSITDYKYEVEFSTFSRIC